MEALIKAAIGPRAGPLQFGYVAEGTRMASTQIPCITINAAGHRVIDRKHRGVRIYVRHGAVSEREAAQRLVAEIERVEAELERRAGIRRTQKLQTNCDHRNNPLSVRRYRLLPSRKRARNFTF